MVAVKFPTRYVKLDEARLRHGEKVDRLGPLFRVGDPLADDALRSLATLSHSEKNALIDRALREGIDAIPEATPELRALFAELDHVPFWFDRARAERGGSAFLRTGVLGGMVLGAYALVLGYASPAGNKPLAFSGRLHTDGARRLGETSRFVQSVFRPGGTLRSASGFHALVKVRMMHASVRGKLAASPKWNEDAWGAPINQADMAGTALLFSLLASEALEKLGFPLSLEESEDLLHLWRYGAYLLGVGEELRFSTQRDAREFWDLLIQTQELPDDDARMLTRALLDGGVANAKTDSERKRARRARTLGDAVSRYLLGDVYADALGYPRTPLIHAVRGLVPVNRWATRAMGLMPLGKSARLDAGIRYWQTVIDATLGKEPATFAMPESLARKT